ncbi:PEP/pyruvate-binding domain-containing protein [Phytohabitans sp. ZYX-F-186]|uniref:PEP/pyruvate-binding domain-containing protein n=1 Tax=Phytohabitans maris TaxID=3071409 RepID=A0ABU0ZV23_9ACTN|nr:PEP/pyruvate-binding domain-containing protein [Phytohabitans sp. ZYX-F-186]MDQ7910352.1 PEP/pyruvate-binding domain-containing protein [Phytohabitans sp. ZYX-F-186]
MRSSASAETGPVAVPPGLLSLDGPGATDPAVAGAKAASLARARRMGLPALPGLVLPVSAGRAAARAAAGALAGRGAGAARPAALRTRLPEHTGSALRTAVAALGGRVIVRSSSPLEADHRWSGAFSSVGEVGAEDVGTAVRACWASAFAPDPLDRARACGVAPDELALAVLVQPELTPEAGGVARVEGGTVRVTAVAGHPGALLSGWSTGETVVVEKATAAAAGEATAAAVADLAWRAAELLGHDTVEWAVEDGTVHLLQSSRGPAAPAPTGPSATPDGLTVSGTAAVAGDAVGPLRYVRPHQTVELTEPGILVVDRPVPALAPLLFGARGLVSVSGPAQCHLVEVARAIGVPVLTGVDVASVTGPLEQLNAGRRLAAIDGTRAVLVVQPGPAAAPTDPAAAAITATSTLE